MDHHQAVSGRSCRLYLTLFFLPFLAGCTGSTLTRFSAEPGEGTFRFLTVQGETAGMKIAFNHIPVLQDALLYEERGRIVCINTVDEIDLVVVFSNTSSGGSMTVTMINTADENREVKSVELVTLAGYESLTAVRTDDQGMEFTGTCNGSIAWTIAPAGDAGWQFLWKTGNDTVSLLLEQGGIPVVLLPGEELHLPPILFH